MAMDILGEYSKIGEDGHAGPVAGHGGQLFPLGHGGAPRQPGDDKALAHAGQGVFCPKGSSCPAEAGNTGGHVPANAQRIQRIRLFPNGPEQAGVTGVQAHHILILPGCLPDDLQHLLQRQVGAVVQAAVRPAQPQQGGVDQTACIDDHLRLAQKFRSPKGDQIRCAAAGADNVYHTASPVFYRAAP